MPQYYPETDHHRDATQGKRQQEWANACHHFLKRRPVINALANTGQDQCREKDSKRYVRSPEADAQLARTVRMHFVRQFLANDVEDRRKQNHRIDADRATHGMSHGDVCAMCKQIESGH